MQRLVHVWLGAFILGAFFVMSISAWYLLKERHAEFAKRSFGGGLLLAVLASLGQLVSGHFNADMVAHEQPAKLAAFEGHFTTGEGGTPLYLLGWPDEEQKTVKGGLAIPGMLSFLVYQDFNRPVPGLDQLETDYGSPPVWLSFQVYHVMVGLGMLFIASTLFACWCRWRGTLFQKRWLLWYFVFAVVPGICRQRVWLGGGGGRAPALDRVSDRGCERSPGGWIDDQGRCVGGGDQRDGDRLDRHVRPDLRLAVRALGVPAQPRDPEGPATGRFDGATDKRQGGGISDLGPRVA